MTKTGLGLAAMLVLGSAAASAQGSASTGQAMPDSNMAPPSGNTGAADNGIGSQGSLTANAGSHSSTVKGPEAAAQLRTNPKPPQISSGDAGLEKDPTQGGSDPH